VSVDDPKRVLLESSNVSRSEFDLLP
jgi:hypothetical protein